MKTRFKAKIDKLFLILFIPTAAVLIAITVVLALLSPISTLYIMIPVDIFTLYFLISPLFGYAELREDALFIKFGFFLKREIPYNKIRGVSRERKFYSDSMMSLKNAFDHVNVKYNSFDYVSISVVENDDFVAKLQEKYTK